MFLIDGNDVLASDRHRLVDGLGRLARAYGTPSVVVFDGPSQPELPQGCVRHGVRVLYAGRATRADVEILRMVERDARWRAITVVTSDRVLVRRVVARGARTAPAPLLRRALAHVERDVA